MKEEYAIGEIFFYEGQKLIVLPEKNPETNCEECFFDGDYGCKLPVMNCLISKRRDKTPIIFKPVPFKFGK